VDTVRRFAGKEVTRAELLANMGPPEEKMLRLYLPESSLTEAVEFFFHHYDRARDEINLFPGILQALEGLQEAGVKVGLFTGMGRRGTRTIFGQLELEKWMAFSVTGDDVENYKPDPEGVLKALAALDVPARQALMVGDSPKDILAGRAAGTKTGAALWGVNDPSRFDGLEADYWFETPGDLLNTVLGMPPESIGRPRS
jgi:HAD superfamily hydrolase (TIGR01549 family)